MRADERARGSEAQGQHRQLQVSASEGLPRYPPGQGLTKDRLQASQKRFRQDELQRAHGLTHMPGPTRTFTVSVKNTFVDINCDDEDFQNKHQRSNSLPPVSSQAEAISLPLVCCLSSDEELAEWASVLRCSASSEEALSSKDEVQSNASTASPYNLKGRKSKRAPAGSTSNLDHQGEEDEEREDPRTTVMLRSIPATYSRDSLVELLDSEGFNGHYDFVYLPIDNRDRRCFGYAFINFVTAADRRRFWYHFEGFTGLGAPVAQHSKACTVSWSDTTQGLEAHVERFRNSPLMHEDMPDCLRPALFRDGARVLFPPPTGALRMPRQRRNRKTKPWA